MKKYHLSTYISVTMTILVAVSTFVVSGLLYYNLSGSLTAEFEERVKAECGEVGQVLRRQFKRSENRLRELSLDNTVRVTLMLGATQQLREYLREKYSLETDLHFYVTALTSDKIFTSSDSKLSRDKLRSLLDPDAVNKKRFIEENDDYGFVYSFSAPILRQKNQIGMAAGIYILNRDRLLLKFTDQNLNSRILKMNGNRAWDLLSGQFAGEMTKMERSQNNNRFFYSKLNEKQMIAVELEGFPDLVYISGLNKLFAAKKKVLTLVFVSSFFVLLLTIIISLVLSRILTLPLSQLSKQSLEMLDGKSDLEQKKISSNLIEVEQLMTSLSEMVKGLKKTEELKRYRELFLGVTDPIFIFDLEGRFVEANEIAEKVFQYTRDEFLRMNFTDLVQKEDREKVSQSIKSLSQKKQRIVFETKLLTKEKELIWIECHARQTTYQQKNLIIGVARDITERKRSQELIIQSEKMMSVGGLAAGMAHEINNPLAGMMQNAQVVINRLTVDMKANEDAALKSGITISAIRSYMEERNIYHSLENIVTAGKNAAKIVDNMLSYARKDSSVKSKQSIPDLIEKTIELAESDYDLKKKYDFKQVEIQKDFEQGIPEVFCEKSKIMQVLFNVVKNATESMYEAVGGTRTAKLIFSVKKINNAVEIEIKDNGPGMKEVVRKRIFEPFFTTKDVDKGTGLGLSLSYYIIVDDHGGEMMVNSKPGKGTVFIIRLPVE